MNRTSLAERLHADPYLRWTVIVLIMIAGVSSLWSLPRIEDPRITTRNAVITTVLPGAPAARIEAEVTKPLEDALREVAEIRRIESTSRAGVSVIEIELRPDITRDTNEAAFARVRDRLRDAEHGLPPDAGRPQFDDQRGAVAFTLITALVWRASQPPDLALMARTADELADRLRPLSGTELVRQYGAADEALRVSIDPQALALVGLSAAEVRAAIANADTRLSAGQLHAHGQRLSLEVSGRLDDVAAVAAVPLRTNRGGELLRVGDVATVERTHRDPRDALAMVDGAAAVLVAARALPGVQVGTWADRAHATLDELRAVLDPSMSLEVTFDQRRYTDARLRELGGNLAGGALMVIAIVWLFMGWRPALIVGSALPLSAALSLFGLNVGGQALHQMSIFGMIIAIGLLIDNAIVMTDDVVRRRRNGTAPGQAIRDALKHLTLPLAASTLTTILGFMPIFLLIGNVGDFVGPIAIAVVIALIASSLVAMTLTPALAAATPLANHAPTFWRDGLHWPGATHRFRNLLDVLMRWPRLTLLSIAAAALAGAALATTLPSVFFPAADRDQLQLRLWMSSDTGIDATARRVAELDALLAQQSRITGRVWLAGGSVPNVYYNQLMTEEHNSAHAQAVLQIDGPDDIAALARQLQRMLDVRFPDARIVVTPFGQGPPIDAPVGVRLIGNDLDTLAQLGDDARALMHQVPQIIHTRASLGAGEPKLQFVPVDTTLELAGISRRELAAQLAMALDGVEAASAREDLQRLPVRVRAQADRRDDLAKLEALQIVAPGGSISLPASALGHFALVAERSAITRRDGERVNQIDAEIVVGSTAIDVQNAVLDRLRALSLPPGYRLETGGDSAEQADAVRALTANLPLIIALMVATIVLAFRHLPSAAIIGVVAALSAGFGLLALWVSGYPLGFNPLIGTAGLVGVAINGSIVMLAALRALPPETASDPGQIIAATLHQSRHILSTTLTTTAGFIPLLVLTGGAFWPPLAIVIAGGVLLSVVLSLVFTPCAYLLMASGRPQPSDPTLVPPPLDGLSTAARA